MQPWSACWEPSWHGSLSCWRILVEPLEAMLKLFEFSLRAQDSKKEPFSSSHQRGFLWAAKTLSLQPTAAAAPQWQAPSTWPTMLLALRCGPCNPRTALQLCSVQLYVHGKGMRCIVEQRPVPEKIRAKGLAEAMAALACQLCPACHALVFILIPVQAWVPLLRPFGGPQKVSSLCLKTSVAPVVTLLLPRLHRRRQGGESAWAGALQLPAMFLCPQHQH